MSVISEFTPAVLEKLQYYVYLLSDPRSNAFSTSAEGLATVSSPTCVRHLCALIRLTSWKPSEASNGKDLSQNT
jgi:hypothetical protein